MGAWRGLCYGDGGLGLEGLFKEESMAMTRIETIYLAQGDPKLPTFLAWCKEHGLFDATLGERGRMLRVYDGRRPTVSVSAAVAYEGPLPIGVCLVEPQSEARHPARVLHMDSRRKQPRVELPWCFVDVGFVSFYVDPGSRGAGVARALMGAVEDLLAHRHRAGAGDRLMATAHGRAQGLVNGSRWVSLNPCSPAQGNWGLCISSLAEEVLIDGVCKPTMGEVASRGPKDAPLHGQWREPRGAQEKLTARRGRGPGARPADRSGAEQAMVTGGGPGDGAARARP